MVAGSRRSDLCWLRRPDRDRSAGHRDRGQPVKKVPAELLVEEVFKEVDRYSAAGKKVVIDDAHAAEAARWLSEQKDDTTL
jgi:hypothetical protein